MIAGAVIGAVTAVALILLPGTALESIIARTHLADVISAAQPPFGTKARVLISLIPFVLLSAAGIVLGLVWRGRKKEEFGDYGAYVDYGDDDDRPVADPFAMADAPAIADPYETPAIEAPAIDEAPPPAAPESLPTPLPVAIAPAAAPLDGATARDLAEIADAVVRLDARLDAIEAKLDAPAPALTSADLTKRLAKIAKALDEAG